MNTLSKKIDAGAKMEELGTILRNQLLFMEPGQKLALPLPQGHLLENFARQVASRVSYGFRQGFHGRCVTARDRLENSVIVRLEEDL